MADRLVAAGALDSISLADEAGGATFEPPFVLAAQLPIAIHALAAVGARGSRA